MFIVLKTGICADPLRLSLPRLGHTWTLCGGGSADSAYLFAGYSFTDGLHNDVWRYDVTAGDWTSLDDNVRGPKPAPR